MLMRKLRIPFECRAFRILSKRLRFILIGKRIAGRAEFRQYIQVRRKGFHTIQRSLDVFLPLAENRICLNNGNTHCHCFLR